MANERTNSARALLRMTFVFHYVFDDPFPGSPNSNGEAYLFGCDFEKYIGKKNAFGGSTESKLFLSLPLPILRFVGSTHTRVGDTKIQNERPATTERSTLDAEGGSSPSLGWLLRADGSTNQLMRHGRPFPSRNPSNLAPLLRSLFLLLNHLPRGVVHSWNIIPPPKHPRVRAAFSSSWTFSEPAQHRPLPRHQRFRRSDIRASVLLPSTPFGLGSTASRRSTDTRLFAAMSDPCSSNQGPSAASSSNNNNNPNQLLSLRAGQLRCRYFALRHGQSQANVQKLIASHPEVACSAYGLSPLGIQQARKAGHDVVEHFTHHFSSSGTRGRVVILASDLLRAQQTAEIVRDVIRAHNNAQLPSDDPSSSIIPLYRDGVIGETRLRERGFGNWDLTSDDNYQHVWDDDATDSSHTANHVESVDSVMRRVTSAVAEWDGTLSQDDLTSYDPTRTMVICVAHGDVLQILQTAFEKLDGTLHRTLPHLETATLRPLVLKAVSDESKWATDGAT
jgi:broad specificity phosphatase PhoE